MMELHVDPQGNFFCIYGEDLDLASLGCLQIVRASQVEPDAGGLWWADMSPSRGPRLGPFGKRSEAIGAECIWLSGHMIPGDEPNDLPACLASTKVVGTNPLAVD
jgi:hypothetical protein